MSTLTLAGLGIDNDPGTGWHPRPDKDGVRDANGDLFDLDTEQVRDHQAKPETDGQYDAGELLGAEDSTESPKDEV